MIPKVNNWPLHSHADLSIYTWTHSFTHTRTHIYTCAAYTDKSSLFFFTFYTKLWEGGSTSPWKQEESFWFPGSAVTGRCELLVKGSRIWSWDLFKGHAYSAILPISELVLFKYPWRNRLEKKCEHIHIKIFNFAKGKINFLFRKGGIKWSFVAEIFNTLEISITICLYSSNEQKVFNKTINYIAVARK